MSDASTSAPQAAVPFHVRNKVALVTGANRGIGLCIVEGLLAAGATKVYAGVRTLSSADRLVRTHGTHRVVPLHIDLSDADSIRRAAEAAPDTELVVNNAGVLNIVDPRDGDAFLAALQNQMNVNAFGLARMAQAFGPILEGHGGGALVQVNSTSSLRCPGPGFAGYAASKAAAYALTQGLRGSLPRTRVLSVHPGPISTDMVDQFGGRDRSEPPEQVAEAIVGALEKGDQFLVFTDTFSRGMGEDYIGFAQKHVTGGPGY